MKKFGYNIFKHYVKICFLFYFKNLRIEGAENIPKKKAVIFIGNHQNALIDALLVATTLQREIFFLTQAQVFKNSTVKKILTFFHMLPIYRIRDGYGTLSKNEAIFQKCYRILDQQQTLLIFAEGSHNLQRRVRVLSKGFTRIAFGALEHNPDNEIDIVPVGYNYSNAKAYGSKASFYYGKPISINYYWKNYDKNESIVALRNEVRNQLKKLTTHIEDKENYDEIVQHFKADDFLYPEKVNKQLEDLNSLPPIPTKKKKKFNPLLLLVKINSFFPLLIWKKASAKIKEEEFIATFRFTMGIATFPIFYLIQMGIISYLFGSIIGFIYLIISILSVYVLAKTIRKQNPINKL